MSVVLRLRNPEIDDEQVDRQTQTDRGLAEESVLLQQTFSRSACIANLGFPMEILLGQSQNPWLFSAVTLFSRALDKSLSFPRSQFPQILSEQVRLGRPPRTLLSAEILSYWQSNRKGHDQSLRGVEQQASKVIEKYS